MWLVSFLPDWIWGASVVAGIAMIFVSYLPLISIYKLPLQLAGIVLAIAGVWFLGAAHNEAAWKEKVAGLEIKLKEADKKSKEKNVVIEQQIVTEIKRVKVLGEERIKYIDKEVIKDREVIKFIENCPIPTIIIEQHNAAAILEKKL